MRPMFAEYPGVPGLDSFDEFMKMVSKILALSKTRIAVLCSLQLKKNSDKAITACHTGFWFQTTLSKNGWVFLIYLVLRMHQFQKCFILFFSGFYLLLKLPVIIKDLPGWPLLFPTKVLRLSHQMLMRKKTTSKHVRWRCCGSQLVKLIFEGEFLFCTICFSQNILKCLYILRKKTYKKHLMIKPDLQK